MLTLDMNDIGLDIMTCASLSLLYIVNEFIDHMMNEMRRGAWCITDRLSFEPVMDRFSRKLPAHIAAQHKSTYRPQVCEDVQYMYLKRYFKKSSYSISYSKKSWPQPDLETHQMIVVKMIW